MELILIIVIGAVSGLSGAYAMNSFMRKISAAYSKRVDMILALGSYFTGQIKGAARLGNLIHMVAGIVFGTVYLMIMYAIGGAVLPYSLFLGIGFGFFHGMFMSYMLMFYASERHPVEAYRKATLEEGLLHLVGHLIFGAVTGFIGGFLCMIVVL